jgi:uncharacterized alkaline shock family protein YloU
VNLKERQPSGSLQISQEVIATIAGVAAQEIEGVSGLNQFGPGIGHSLFRKGLKKPVDVSMSDGFAEIDIGVTLGYGARIGEVCTAVQKAVKENVQTMTGMIVNKVNVYVAHISFPEESPPPAA